MKSNIYNEDKDKLKEDLLKVVSNFPGWPPKKFEDFKMDDDNFDSLSIRTLKIQMGEVMSKLDILNDEIVTLKEKLFGLYGMESELDNVKSSVDSIESRMNEYK